MIAAVAPEPSPLLEFALRMSVETPGDDAAVAGARARLTAWIRSSTASEAALLDLAEGEAVEVERILDRPSPPSEPEEQRLRRFGIATSAAAAQHRADREIDAQLE